MRNPIFACSLFLISDKKTRINYLLVALVVIPLFVYVIFPSLDNFTGGSLSARFSDVESTGRIEIIRSDIEVFRRYPIFGVGPLQSKPFHAIYFRYSSTHTEYSRMLAEHGIFGLISLLVLIGFTTGRFLSKNSNINKAFIVGFMVWGFLFMAHAATRLVAPSFLIGLGFLKFQLDDVITPQRKKTTLKKNDNQNVSDK